MTDAEAAALRAELTALRQVVECALTGLYTVDGLRRLAAGARRMADETPPTEPAKARAAVAAARIYEAAIEFGNLHGLIGAAPEGSA